MSNLAGILSPKIVITSPEGKQYWIDPLAPSTGQASPIPKGFSLDIKTGDIPKDDPNVTDSALVFALEETPTILWNLEIVGIPFPLIVAVVLGYLVYKSHR